MLSRREFLKQGCAGVAGAAAIGLGSSGIASAATRGRVRERALTPFPVQLSWVKDAEFAGYYIGDTQGLYSKEGLDVSLTAGGPNVTSEQVVAAGRALVGLDSSDYITAARDQGAPLVIIGAGFQKNPIGIMSLKKEHITTPKDLIGKKLGIPNGEQTPVTTFLKLNGVDPSSVHFLPYGTDPTPIANGELDAALAFTTTDPYLLQSKGFETNTMLLADYGYNVYNDCPFVTEDTLKNHRSELVAFMKATIKGWEYNIAHPKYVIPLILDNYGKALGFTYNSQYFQNVAQNPLYEDTATREHGLFWMSPADIEVNLKTITDAKIKTIPSIFDLTILEEVYDGAHHL